MTDFLCVNGKWNCPTAPCQKPSQPGHIPLKIAEEAYKEYAAQYGTQQSFERLNERGGFSTDEIAILLCERCRRLSRESEQLSAASVALRKAETSQYNLSVFLHRLIRLSRAGKVDEKVLVDAEGLLERHGTKPNILRLQEKPCQ